MKAVPLIIGAIAALVLVVAGLLLASFIDLGPAPSGPGIDSTARIQLEALRQEVDLLEARVRALEARPTGGAIAAPSEPLDSGGSNRTGPNEILDAYAQTVSIAARRDINAGITVATPSFLEGFLGRPRETLSDNCEPMTNPNLKSALVVEQVGPIKVQMLRPALDSLKRVFAKIEATDPDLYARINTAGSLCVRQIRGTRGRTSTHSFGLAVDINIDGKLDVLGDGKTQLGLTIIADFFKAEGWIWGAGFSREDSMHFEVSKEQLEAWRAENKI